MRKRAIQKVSKGILRTIRNLKRRGRLTLSRKERKMKTKVTKKQMIVLMKYLMTKEKMRRTSVGAIKRQKIALMMTFMTQKKRNKSRKNLICKNTYNGEKKMHRNILKKGRRKKEMRKKTKKKTKISDCYSNGGNLIILQIYS